jgi:hypothetical protein
MVEQYLAGRLQSVIGAEKAFQLSCLNRYTGQRRPFHDGHGVRHSAQKTDPTK